MPTTKPGVELNGGGLCQGCVHHEMRAENDYEARWKRLEKIAAEYRCDDGGYDCIIPVSGGKDSHYQTYILNFKIGC
jgi:tRNA(Ile)-lysidine synthase TilS/MesJ